MKTIIAAILTMALSVHAQWNDKGVPDNLVENVEVSTSLLRDISRILPERAVTPVPEAKPELFSGEYSSNIQLLKEANVYITFIHEGAGFRNSFGYFIYTPDNIPQNISEVELLPVFPNSSYQGSGGGLKTGNTVKIGPFPAGTVVGFWVKANAWNSTTKTVGSGYWTHTTLPSLNVENDENKKAHVAMFYHEESGKLIMGFEDINRESRSCDQDFNDLIFFATTDPVDAINTGDFVTIDADYDADNDGIPDHSDVYPDDAERASDRYYPAQGQEALLAFEDNFPSKGDYDFNDLITTYSSHEVLNAQGQLKELVMNMKVKAMGALYHNGFAIQFPFHESKIESASLLINGVSSSYYPVEAGHEDETVINIMNAAPHHINMVENFPNTLPDTGEKRGDRFELRLIFKDSVRGVAWPYNPFLYIDQVRGREVHLAGKQPTEFMDSNFFGIYDDVTEVGTDNTYKDIDGMPFAMLLPADWEWPEEFVDITNVYPTFIPWAESGGIEHLDWPSIKVQSLIWKANDAFPTSDDFDNDAKAAFWSDVDKGTRPSLIEEVDQKLKMTVSAADIWYSTENYTARAAELTGDFDVSIKIEHQDNTHPWAKAGLMVKHNMHETGNIVCLTGITPSNGFIFQYDWRGNGQMNGSRSVNKSTQGLNNYVRLVRVGNKFTGYHKQSLDGEWTPTYSFEYSDVPETLHVGPFAASHSYDYGTVIFDNWLMR